jgi:hypothetical protein
MFPFRHSSIFRSRWIAMIWAAGIIWTAIDFASPSSDKAPADANQRDEAASQAQRLLEDFGV